MSVEITMADVHKSVRIPLEDISVHAILVTSLNQTTKPVKVSETYTLCCTKVGKRLIFPQAIGKESKEKTEKTKERKREIVREEKLESFNSKGNI